MGHDETDLQVSMLARRCDGQGEVHRGLGPDELVQVGAVAFVASEVAGEKPRYVACICLGCAGDPEALARYRATAEEQARGARVTYGRGTTPRNTP